VFIIHSQAFLLSILNKKSNNKVFTPVQSVRQGAYEKEMALSKVKVIMLIPTNKDVS